MKKRTIFTKISITLIILAAFLAACQNNAPVASDQSLTAGGGECPAGEQQRTAMGTRVLADQYSQAGDIEGLRKILIADDPSNQKVLKGFSAFFAAGGKFEIDNCVRRIIKEEQNRVVIRSACDEKVILGDQINEGRTGDDVVLVKKGNCWYITNLGEWPVQ